MTEKTVNTSNSWVSHIYSEVYSSAGELLYKVQLTAAHAEHVTTAGCC